MVGATRGMPPTHPMSFTCDRDDNKGRVMMRVVELFRVKKTNGDNKKIRFFWEGGGGPLCALVK